MTARIEVSGELMMDPQSTVIGGEPMAGAPLFVRLPVSPMAGGVSGEVGPAVLFVTATGSGADALAAFRQGDTVRVSGALRLARYLGNDAERESFACEADSVEPAARH